MKSKPDANKKEFRRVGVDIKVSAIKGDASTMQSACLVVELYVPVTLQEDQLCVVVGKVLVVVLEKVKTLLKKVVVILVKILVLKIVIVLKLEIEIMKN